MSTEGAQESIANFYIGKSIFITGGTGFVGKVLIEKLLYSCPGIDKIYILIRKTNKANEEQKFEKLLKSQVFTRLKAEKPQDLAKVIPITGDLEAPDLGIKVEDMKTLVEQVSVVFHSAATINFNSPLREALVLNVEGTKKVLDLSLQMRRLQAFVHISTAFCNLHEHVIEEKVYPPPAKLEDVYRYLEEHEHSKKILNGHPNTYTFTKALSEALLVEQRQNIPLIILRPSVVMPSKNEPMPGWVDNWQGAVGILAAVAKGWVQSLPGDLRDGADFVPVDHVSNMAIIAAAKNARSDQISVYHCCTKAVNPETYENVVKYFVEEGIRNGYNEVAKPGVLMTNNNVLLALLIFFREIVPAYLLDLGRTIKRRRPRYVHCQSQLSKLRNALRPFICGGWIFCSERAQALVTSLSPSDRRLFPCHPADVDWKPYVETCAKGVIKYLSK